MLKFKNQLHISHIELQIMSLTYFFMLYHYNIIEYTLKDKTPKVVEESFRDFF